MVKTLIVEDESALGLMMQDYLEAIDHNVTEIVPTGSDALKSIERTRPDVVLLDISLEGDLDGFETAVLIRERYDIPIVFLTGHGDIETQEKAEEFGAYGFFLKPIKFNELEELLKTLA